MEFLFITMEGRGFGVWLADGGVGVEIRVTNYLVRFTPSLSANFEVKKKCLMFLFVSRQR